MKKTKEEQHIESHVNLTTRCLIKALEVLNFDFLRSTQRYFIEMHKEIHGENYKEIDSKKALDDVIQQIALAKVEIEFLMKDI